MKKCLLLFSMFFILTGNVYAKEFPNNTLELSSGQEAAAIGFIGESPDSNQIMETSEQEAVAIGEIGGKSTKGRAKGVAKATLTVNGWSKDYLVLNYNVDSNLSSMLNSTSTVKLYDKKTGNLLSSAAAYASSKSPTNSLSSSITMWVGS